MKKILLSIAMVALLSGGVIGATGAFFSDTETSSGNTFAAGAIDLKVDNESYYNGNKCVDADGDGPGLEHIWQGTALYPSPGSECDTSFPASDLDNGLFFFHFQDLKPDDEGEDTISLHVDNNDAYACMDLTLTSDDDNSSNEPELEVDTQDDVNNTWDGELAGALQFFWWADDGDNVYEDNEQTISGGVKTLMDLASTTGPFSVALADSVSNVWGTPGPIPGNQTRYIGKAWCFGTLTLNPLPQGQGLNPSVASGITCNGTALGNLYQTDGVTLDVAFRTVQARHNPTFQCGNTQTRTAKLTVVKQIINDNGGNNVVPDFQLKVVGTVVTPVTSGATTTLAVGNYTVTETGVSGYVASFSGDCNASGQITLAAGDEKICYITNNDLPANITLIKNVVGGVADPVQFSMRVDAGLVQNNTSVAVTSNAVHTISEDAFPGYHFTSITGAGCPATLPGNVSLTEGQAIVCTITNTAN